MFDPITLTDLAGNYGMFITDMVDRSSWQVRRKLI